MLDKVLQLLSLTCRHRRTSKPFATASSVNARAVGDWEAVTPTATGHYVVCLDCGRKFAYDWSEMRIVK
jgi:hypothetical protein